LLDGVEQWFGPAAVDLGIRLRLAEEAVEVKKAVLVLRLLAAAGRGGRRW
jgi:hypothetical protein